MHIEPVSTTPDGKKGRPTPKRKAAEAARIHPLVPKDRKEAKRAARAARNARFEAEQRAMVTGEEKYLPAIILIMVLSMLGNKIPLQYQAYMLYGSSILMYGSFIITAIEAILVWRKVKRTFTEAHPREDIPSGTAYYTFSRMIMPRRWRSPRPQVDRGQFPK